MKADKRGDQRQEGHLDEGSKGEIHCKEKGTERDV